MMQRFFGPAQLMRTIVILAASSLLFAAAIVEIPSRLWPDSPLALLIVAVVALLAQGLLAARLFAAEPAPAPTARPEPEARQTARSEGSRRGNRRERTETPPSGPPPAGGERETGSVKWFNRSKGFGFIIRDTGGEIFVHQRSIRSDGGNDGRRPSLKDGQAVTFLVVERDKGLQAEDVAPQS
jgi:CspA family cold shock protein